MSTTFDVFIGICLISIGKYCNSLQLTLVLIYMQEFPGGTAGTMLVRVL